MKKDTDTWRIEATFRFNGQFVTEWSETRRYVHRSTTLVPNEFNSYASSWLTMKLDLADVSGPDNDQHKVARYTVYRNGNVHISSVAMRPAVVQMEMDEVMA